MSKWTKEPWRLHPEDKRAIHSGDNPHPDKGCVAFDLREDDATRIVACINACAGIRDPAAFMEGVRELVAYVDGSGLGMSVRGKILLAKISAAQEPSDEA